MYCLSTLFHCFHTLKKTQIISLFSLGFTHRPQSFASGFVLQISHINNQAVAMLLYQSSTLIFLAPSARTVSQRCGSLRDMLSRSAGTDGGASAYTRYAKNTRPRGLVSTARMIPVEETSSQLYPQTQHNDFTAHWCALEKPSRDRWRLKGQWK